MSDEDRKSDKRRRLNKDEALAMMERYCVYQDRCHHEVRSRLIEHQVYGDDLEDIISSLITDKFLDEERFAVSYAVGKSKIKRWGRVKIKQELKRRYISEYCIKKGLAAIDEEIYYDNLIKELSKKWSPDSIDYRGKQKVIQSLQRKGYTYAEIKNGMDDLSANDN